MAILLSVTNAGDETNTGAAQARAVRVELGMLINRLYPGGWKAAAHDLEISYNTLRRALTVDAKDATATIDLGMVLTVYAKLQRKFPDEVDPFVDFFAHATRHVS